MDYKKIKKQMKTSHTLILLILISISNLKAQEPILISGYGIEEGTFGRILGDFGKDVTSQLFLQEKATISIPPNGVYVINLTEESAKKIGKPQIGIIYINNAGIILPPYSEKELITLQVLPVNTNNTGASRLYQHYNIPIYFCKHYQHQDSLKQSVMEMYNKFEQDITNFLEQPPIGDTLHSSVIQMLKDRTDSRYTPLIIKNLTNEGEIAIKYEGHYHTIPASKKEISETHYTVNYIPIRISDLMRTNLEKIFYAHSIGSWTFKTPDIEASAEEWETWLYELLKDNK